MNQRANLQPDRDGRASLPLSAWVAAGGLLIAVLLFGAGFYLWFGGGAKAVIGGPFTLENGARQTVTDRSFRGKYMLVYFGYTYCPDVCPTTLNEVAGALDRLGSKANRVVPIFITVDPVSYTHLTLPTKRIV